MREKIICLVYQRHRNCRGGGVRDHRWFGLPSKEGIKVMDQEVQPLFNRFQGNVLSILPGYRYRQVLFAPSDTHEVVFAFLCERSARKYCSNDGFLEGMARSSRRGAGGNRATWKNDRQRIRREREGERIWNLMRGQIVKHEV